MSYHSTATPSLAANLHGALSNVGSFFAALGRGIVANSSGARRLERIERLEAKSDAELAELGLRREDILHHVFKDLYYI
ncbi:DUF1127 domain-containing protein [Sulfitobacter aestuarii]|uniref:DUF1127 domain-containing protein n=1 Tax=Sulfitobacter aestuarii TaxID=2161676 RepID=A0ABW5TYV0_9RHOB